MRKDGRNDCDRTGFFLSELTQKFLAGHIVACLHIVLNQIPNPDGGNGCDDPVSRTFASHEPARNGEREFFLWVGPVHVGHLLERLHSRERRVIHRFQNFHEHRLQNRADFFVPQLFPGRLNVRDQFFDPIVHRLKLFFEVLDLHERFTGYALGGEKVKHFLDKRILAFRHAKTQLFECAFCRELSHHGKRRGKGLFDFLCVFPFRLLNDPIQFKSGKLVPLGLNEKPGDFLGRFHFGAFTKPDRLLSEDLQKLIGRDVTRRDPHIPDEIRALDFCPDGRDLGDALNDVFRPACGRHLNHAAAMLVERFLLEDQPHSLDRGAFFEDFLPKDEFFRNDFQFRITLNIGNLTTRDVGPFQTIVEKHDIQRHDLRLLARVLRHLAEFREHSLRAKQMPAVLEQNIRPKHRGSADRQEEKGKKRDEKAECTHNIRSLKNSRSAFPPPAASRRQVQRGGA